MLLALCIESDGTSKLTKGKIYLIVPMGTFAGTNVCDVYIPITKEHIEANGNYGSMWMQKRFKPINLTPDRSLEC